MNLSVTFYIASLLGLTIAFDEEACVQSNNRVKRDISKEHLQDLMTLRDNTATTNHVAYFSGSELIRFPHVFVNLRTFTVEFWVRLEGGQIDGVPICKIYSHCSDADMPSSTIGIKEMQQGSDLRFYFQLQSSMKHKATILTSHQTVEVHKWTHVAAMYDGNVMTLYVNQAKVARNFEQNGLFLLNTFHACASVEVGGDAIKHTAFRGLLDRFVIWRSSRSQQEIVETLHSKEFSTDGNNILYEDFNLLSNNPKYYSVTGSPLKTTTSYVPNHQHDIQIDIPQCGHTVCDNLAIITSYVRNPSLLTPKKILNYNLIQLRNSDGSNPTVTEYQIQKNHIELKRIFSEYNIVLRLKHVTMYNDTSLRNKTVVLSCYGQCPNGCKTDRVANPCDRICTLDKIRNNVCDAHCNNFFGQNNRKNWDGGDCCNRNITQVSETCYDPQSPFRHFIKDTELKKTIANDNKYHLNLIPVKIVASDFGKSTFPWVPGYLGVQGGTIVSLNGFGAEVNSSINAIVHEIGHNLGLWHVHKGVSEITNCQDLCAEYEPAMTSGDLCADTNPTPVNRNCVDRITGGNCIKRTYSSTPYRNFMGYSLGACANAFTAQQKARMHCYVDHFYQTWQGKHTPPSPVPLPPRVLTFKGNKLRITWLPPVGFGRLYNKHRCQSCKPSSQIFTQFAIRATSFQKEKKFSIDEVLGPPDAIPCSPHNHAWLLDECPKKNCYLDVFFKKEVVPSALKVWVTFKATNGLKNIELFHKDNSTTSLGFGTGHCDIPYTHSIETNKTVTHVRFHVYDNPVAIDAVQLISKAKNRNCDKCKKLLTYKVYRKPQFATGEPFTSVENQYFDDFVSGNIEYEYRVGVVSGNLQSQLSPPLKYTSNQSFCGNGKTDSDEECDDGNLRNNDGCTIHCKIELKFNCKLQPSLCYIHEKDGNCEEFEKSTVPQDCGFYTPAGFLDQWAENVTGEASQQSRECSESVVAGQPSLNLKCVSYFETIDPTEAWRPCRYRDINRHSITEYVVEAHYQNAVVAAAVFVYFASDASGLVGSSVPTVKIDIKDTEGKYHFISEESVSCHKNPVVAHVMHNMTQQFFHTSAVKVRFSALHDHLAISAVMLRSADAQYYHKCAPNELYDPRRKACRKVKTDTIACAALHVENALHTCTGSDEGDTCNITCKHGFVPRETFVTHCKFGEWKNVKDCRMVDCGTPSFLHAMTYCLFTHSGSVCKFSCNRDTHQQGNDTTVVCQKDGTWSQVKAHCYVTCPIPRLLENSELYLTDVFENPCRGVGAVKMGSICRYRCLSGFRPLRTTTGTVSGGNTVNLVCDDAGKWRHDGVCVRVQCPPLSTIDELMYNCTNGNNYRSVCSTTCLGTRLKAHHVECLENEQWSSGFHVCDMRVGCEPIRSTSSDIDTSACRKRHAGSVCRPVCLQKPDYIPDIRFKGVTSTPGDVALYCMPNQAWLPPPDLLECSRPCKRMFMGDGYCDCPLNRPHCNYDGGDCCPSSQSVKYIFKTSPRCDCVDPKALLLQKSSQEGSADDELQTDDNESGDYEDDL